MKKLLLLFIFAIMSVPAIFANEVYFYFQDGEEDDFELMAPQSLVSIWNETDEEPVLVPDDMAFMSYQFEGAKILRISASDFDFEVVVEVEGDDYFLDKEDTEWYLTLLPEADNLEIYVRVYLAGQAPGQSASNVTMNFNIQTEDSEIANPGECVSISYFDINLFQTVTLQIEDNYAGASVAPGAAFEIVPAEGYVVTDVMTYLPGVASISEPGDDENVWRLSVSYEPESDFAAFFVTVAKAETENPEPEPTDATITQIEALQWKVEWPAYTLISQTDTDYNNNNAFITDSRGKITILYADLHGEHENPAITFPEWGNYFTINLGGLNLEEGTYALTIPEEYVSLGTERTPSTAQYFELEVGKSVENSYNVQISDVDGNTFDISWENVTKLTPGVTEGAYVRNVMTNEEFQLEYLKDDMYSKCNLRIYNNSILRVNLTNNGLNLTSGLYEFYLPADYVKFNDTETGNEAIEAYMFTYNTLWSEGEIEFTALPDENKLVVKWVDATEIAYNTEYKGDGQGISGITIFDSSNIYINLDYPEDFTISGNVLTIDLTGMPIADGECTLLIPEDCLFVTVDGITDYTFGTSFRFNYGNGEGPDGPKFYDGIATWSHQTGNTVYTDQVIEVSWNNNELAFVADAEKFSVHSFTTGILELAYGADVNLSEDKTKILISLASVPKGTYRVNVPEGCVTIDVDGTEYLNTATSMDGVIVSDQAGVASVVADGGRYTVVSVSGVVVLDTEDASALDRLPQGFYIVNGKKMFVK